jgi:hypothetical protein
MDRTNTIPPPPPADEDDTEPDRERDTDPPGPGEEEEGKPALRLSEQVALQLLEFEDALKAQLVRLDKLDKLHDLLIGVTVDPKTGKKATIFEALHTMSGTLDEIKKNQEKVLANHREYVDEVHRVHNDNVRFRVKLKEHDARLDKIESSLPPNPLI